jgi:hypothetical protein
MSIASLSYDVTNANPIGLATLANASKMLADFGRNGDTYVVHAKEGETVIPMEVLDNNPRLKDMLFQQMRDLDLDPYRYIVGNELNSINPDTGQPEFFIKKLFKGLKKVVKKVAPVVLPIAAPFLLPTMPLFLSTGIGTLAGGLIGGQKPQDALRNAIISGGLAGLGNMAFGQGGFTGSAVDAGIASAPQPTVTGGAIEKGFPTGLKQDTGILQTLKDSGSKAVDSVSSFYDKYISPSRQSIQPTNEVLVESAKKSADAQIKALEAVRNKPLSVDAKDKLFTDAFKTAQKELAPSAFQKFAPVGGLTALGLYGLDKAGLPIFTVPEEEMGPGMPTGLDLLRMDPDRFKFTNFYGDNPYYQDRTAIGRPVPVAEGGEIVGPGTATSDSIPAMLSDGEFVMNAKAVRGAGGGDRKQGAKRMYQMMKKFERVA